MARIQEDNLRREYVSTPAAAVPCRRDPEMIPAYLNTNVDDDLGPENKTKSSCASTSPSASSSCCKSPTSAPKQSCQSPKLSRLHQQVTQFKLLRLAQNQGASPCRTRSPLRTSLRSLQAVRNSRSLETDDHQTAGQITCPPSGVSTTTVPSCGSPLLSAASLNSSNRGMSARITAMKKLQRSQSLSPSRMAHPARGFLSAQGRVFASPERPTTAAWGRHVSSVQR